MMPPLDTTPWTGDERPFLAVRRSLEATPRERIVAVLNRARKESLARPKDALAFYTYAMAGRRAASMYGIPTSPATKAQWSRVEVSRTREFARLRTLYYKPAKGWLTNPGIREFFRSVDRLLASDPVDKDILSRGAEWNAFLKLGDKPKAIRYARRLVALDPDGRTYDIGRYRLGFALAWSMSKDARGAAADAKRREAIDNFTRYLKIAPPWQDYERSVAQSLTGFLRGKLAESEGKKGG